MIKRVGLTLAVLAVLILGAAAASAQVSSGDAPAGEEAEKFALEDKVFADDGKFDVDFVADGLFVEELSPELVEEINSETDALVEHLQGLGFTVDVATYEVRKPVFDESDEALWQAIDDFYAAQFAAEVATWSDEEKAEWNAWIDEFVADMAEQGIEVETIEIAPGVFDIVWTEELEEALWDFEEDLDFEEEFDKLDQDLADSNA